MAVKGEVIYEIPEPHPAGGRPVSLRSFIQAEVETRLKSLRPAAEWAGYVVIFSPGQEPGEARCQLDVETEAERNGFAIGFGLSVEASFLDAAERLQWFEKNQPIRNIG